MELKSSCDQPPRLENEDSYKQWREAISLWTIVSDIPKEKQAITVTQRLKGKARETALEITMDDLNSDKGMEMLLKKLDETLNIDPMTIYEAFQAFDSLQKQSFETFKSYAKNFITLYTRLKEVGVIFPEKLLTLKLFSGARLSNFQAVDTLHRTKEGSLESAILNLIRYDGPNEFVFQPASSVSSAFSQPQSAGQFLFGILPKPTSDDSQNTQKVLIPAGSVIPPQKFMFGNPGEEATSSEEQATQSSPDQQSTQPDSDKTGESVSDGLRQNLTEDKWVFGGKLKSLTASEGFASLAALSSGVQNIGFKMNPGFQSQSAEETDESDPATSKCEAQFQSFQYKPPPLIEVKTGKEGEEVLFKERCTLFRYDKETKQWKERGRGDIKIFRNDQHNIYRVVMRREQVNNNKIFNVCANHIINATTKPEPHLGSVKTCSYFAMDYTESPTPTGERFAVRFKTEELCKTYMDKIDEIKGIQNSQL